MPISKRAKVKGVTYVQLSERHPDLWWREGDEPYKDGTAIDVSELPTLRRELKEEIDGRVDILAQGNTEIRDAERTNPSFVTTARENLARAIRQHEELVAAYQKYLAVAEELNKH